MVPSHRSDGPSFLTAHPHLVKIICAGTGALSTLVVQQCYRVFVFNPKGMVKELKEWLRHVKAKLDIVLGQIKAKYPTRRQVSCTSSQGFPVQEGAGVLASRDAQSPWRVSIGYQLQRLSQ